MSVEPQEIIAAFPELEIDPVPLGEGTFKVAHRAALEGQDLVLKVVKQPVDDPDAALPERLRRELEGMKKVASPRIVRIIQGPETREIGNEQHVWYLEPFYPGGTLKDRMQASIEPADVIRLVSELLDGVEALAIHDLVHRDIKPANVIFDADGGAVLLDLGIALHTDMTPITEPFGGSPRTPAYSAPEQFEVRRLAKIDFRTDLFQIGIVAFEALTGVHPFHPEDGDEYLTRLDNGNFDEEALKRVPNEDELKGLITRLLKPSPNQRYRSIEHARRALLRNQP